MPPAASGRIRILSGVRWFCDWPKEEKSIKEGRGCQAGLFLFLLSFLSAHRASPAYRIRLHTVLMPAWIHHIATEVPEHRYEREGVRDVLKQWQGDVAKRRLVHVLHERSGIGRRHSVLADFLPNTTPELYQRDDNGAPVSPGTAARNAVYARASHELAVRLARKTLAGAAGFEAAEVSHVIFVSCTGFTNPGSDYHIIRELGLRADVQRYTLGFMGCYAAFPALRMAAQFCEADSRAVVLVVCLELCTLHLQIDDSADSMLANSIFADGTSAALVSARTPLVNRPVLRLRDFSSSIVPQGEADMAWDIGDRGFNLVLSSYVPNVIGANIRELLETSLLRCGLSLAEIDLWAVHPGGRAILDRVQESLALPPDALATSREVLRDFGNMSSATILFVLERMMSAANVDAVVCAMAFGPGLTVETAVMALEMTKPG